MTETQPSPSVSPEDELLARLRERRLTASNSERPKIVEAFAKIERKYPRDYRFPYERAKLAHPTMGASSPSGVAEEHMYAVHEGAVGGGAAGESGCGCN